MREEDAEPDDVSERVARGFEALVSEESAAHGGPAPPVNAPSLSAAAAPAPAPAAGDAPLSIAATRLVALEGRVRQTMDRLTELVEAQLPETVDGLRADLETLRLELQTSLTQSAEVMAEERKQLRTQIATTVGAANRWFVRARDQINERLEHIAAIAEQAQAQAEVAAVAATAAVTAVTESDAADSDAPAPPPAPAGDPDAAADAVADAAADAVAGAAADGGEEEVEWELDDEDRFDRPAPARPRSTAAPGEPGGGAGVAAVRGDVQELQLEVSTMGESVSQLAAEVARLASRIPARPRGVKLAAGEVELIVEAVLAAMPVQPAPAPAKKAPAKKAPAKKAAAKKAAPAKKRKSEPPLKAAADALAKKRSAGGTAARY